MCFYISQSDLNEWKSEDTWVSARRTGFNVFNLIVCLSFAIFLSTTIMLPAPTMYEEETKKRWIVQFN
jgi:hypothetical protein